MDFRQLTCFVKVADCANFTRAAENCGLAQSSLSQHIAKLERDLGQPVFERLGRKVELTDAGRLLYERAQQILSLAEDAKRRIQEAAEKKRGRVTVGSIPTVAPYWLPPLIQSFCQQNPAAQLEVIEDVTENLVRDGPTWRSRRGCVGTANRR